MILGQSLLVGRNIVFVFCVIRLVGVGVFPFSLHVLAPSVYVHTFFLFCRITVLRQRSSTVIPWRRRGAHLFRHQPTRNPEQRAQEGGYSVVIQFIWGFDRTRPTLQAFWSLCFIRQSRTVASINFLTRLGFVLLGQVGLRKTVQTQGAGGGGVRGGVLYHIEIKCVMCARSS